MPENKRQHYVPQFLLRNFSVRGEGKQVGIFNLTSGTFVPDGKLARQAKKDYFYGKDGKTEKLLQNLEDESAKIIARIITERRMPSWKKEEYSILLMFLIASHSRTPEMASETQEMITKINRQAMLNVPQFKDIADKVSLEIDNPVGFALQTAVTMHPILTDMKCKLLLNRTKTTRLILSDHPVVLYNQLFQDQNDHRGHIGYSSKGLEIYLPVTPFAGLFFYDGAMYEVGSNRNRPVQIDDKKDIEWLNGLQYLNTMENLYFDNTVSKDCVKDLMHRFARYRREERVEIHQAPLKSREGESFDEIIHIHKKDIKCEASFTFVRFSKAALDFMHHGGSSLARDPITVALHREFLRLVRAGERDPGDFWSFVMDETEAIIKRSGPS
jgi:hypothetical protein